MSNPRKIVIGITGASGAIFARRLIEKLDLLSNSENIVHLVFSKNAMDVWRYELDENPLESLTYSIYDPNDYFAPFASGSAGFDTMIICPCSMGTIARIAHGISSDLISRSADVMLKENKKLILVPRETPYNLIHLKNLTALKEAGAIIIPATPSFYSKPKTIIELVDTVVDRILQHAGFNVKSFRWGDK